VFGKTGDSNTHPGVPHAFPSEEWSTEHVVTGRERGGQAQHVEA